MISARFIKSSFIYTVVGALPLLANLVLLPVYTHFISVSDFGLLALYITFTYFVQILMNYGADSYLPVLLFNSKNNPAALRQNVGSVISILFVIGALVTIVFMLAGEWIFPLVFSDNGMSFYPFGFMSVVTAFCNSFFKSYTNLLIYREKSIRYFWLNVIPTMITISVSIPFLYFFRESLMGPMWGRLISSLACFAIVLFFYLREFGITIHRPIIRDFINFCTPVLIYFLLVWLSSYADRFIINSYMTPEEVGIFDFVVKCTLIIEFFQTGLASAIMPKIYGIWNQSSDKKSTPEMNRYFSGFTAVTLLSIPLINLVLPEAIPLIVKNELYFAGFLFLPIITASFILRGLFNMFISPINYFRKTKYLPLIYLCTATLQIILGFLFISEWGLLGAAFAILLGKSASIVFVYLWGKRVFTFRFNLTKQLFLPLFFIILSVFPFFVSVPLLFWQTQLIQLCIVYAAVLIIYRNEIRGLFQNYIKKAA